MGNLKKFTAFSLIERNFCKFFANFCAWNSQRQKLQKFLHAILSMKKFENKVEFFINNMSSKDAYVIIFSYFQKMWTTLKKSIISKICSFDGTRRRKCIITGFCYRRYSFNRWCTRIHNNLLDNFLKFYYRYIESVFADYANSVFRIF